MADFGRQIFRQRSSAPLAANESWQPAQVECRTPKLILWCTSPGIRAFGLHKRCGEAKLARLVTLYNFQIPCPEGFRPGLPLTSKHQDSLSKNKHLPSYDQENPVSVRRPSRSCPSIYFRISPSCTVRRASTAKQTDMLTIVVCSPETWHQGWQGHPIL